MIHTVMLGRYISVQGFLVKVLPNGLIQVRDGDKVYQGKPV